MKRSLPPSTTIDSGPRTFPSKSLYAEDNRSLGSSTPSNF